MTYRINDADALRRSSAGLQSCSRGLFALIDKILYDAESLQGEWKDAKFNQFVNQIHAFHEVAQQFRSKVDSVSGALEKTADQIINFHDQ
jgi:uncharacterized protein YukE